jgi:hypothetical protein
MKEPFPWSSTQCLTTLTIGRKHVVQTHSLLSWAHLAILPGVSAETAGLAKTLLVNDGNPARPLPLLDVSLARCLEAALAWRFAVKLGSQDVDSAPDGHT